MSGMNKDASVTETTTSWPVIHVRGVRATQAQDTIVHEEPLEIRINDEPWMLVMRTPGQEIAHVAGLLLAEGVIAGAGHIRTITQCEQSSGNRVNAYLLSEAPGVDRTSRGVGVHFSKSSCGLCGKTMISEIAQEICPCDRDPVLTRSRLSTLLERTVRDQVLFAATGGAHGVALYGEQGEQLAFAEDVGRHNALDKVIGHALLEGTLGNVAIAVASSRASFEMVQKVAMAQIPIMATVSAPTDLALDLADRARITLIGFLRGDRLNVYTHPTRLELDA